MLDFLKAAVGSRLNIIVSGGTGAGKTTFLNVLSELHLRIASASSPSRTRRSCAPAAPRGAARNATGQHRRQGRRQAAQLVINALRMRPDRIVVGEVRGEEALDMLQAMNTGHDGSLTTIHANSPRDALYRLDTMVAMANLNIPERAVRQQVASAVNLLVQLTRLSGWHAAA
jgi:pilus assembly protein CpaF